MATDPVYPEALEPDEFWEQHKTKIIVYGILIVVLLGGYAFYALTQQSRKAGSQGLYATAVTIEDFDKIIAEYPGTPAAGSAALDRATALRNEGKYDEAIAGLRAFIEKNPKHPLLAGGWLSLATTYELQGKTAEAIEHYRLTVERFPGEYVAPMALASQARLTAAEGKKAEAIVLYEDLLARYQESILSREAMGALRILKRGSTDTEATSEATPAESAAAPTPEAPATEATPEPQAAPAAEAEASATPAPAGEEG